MIFNDEDLDTLAKTLYGECRGEPKDGQVAVAWVIRNRSQRPRFAVDSVGRAGAVKRVCLAPWQFSCWNATDPNSAILENLSPAKYMSQLATGQMVLDDKTPDPTNGADHYHTIAQPVWANVWPPAWAPEMKEVARFGGHVFYDSRYPA